MTRSAGAGKATRGRSLDTALGIELVYAALVVIGVGGALHAAVAPAGRSR